MYGVVQLGHGVQDDALGLYHGTLQQAELLLLQLLGQLAFTTSLQSHTLGQYCTLHPEQLHRAATDLLLQLGL